MLDVSPALLVLMGGIAGLFNGLLGIGGGWFLVPVLHSLGLSLPQAVGTALTQIVGGTLMGVWRHSRRGNVGFRLGLFFGLFMMLGARFGQSLVMQAEQVGLSRFAIGILYCVVLGYVSLKMLQSTRSSLRQEPMEDSPPSVLSHLIFWGPRMRLAENRPPLPVIPLALLACGVGVISGITGLGGGFFIVPTLLMLGLSLPQAVGTSLLGVFLGSLSGALAYHASGSADLKAGGFLIVGALAGSYTGSSLLPRVDPVHLKFAFALVALLACLSMVMRLILG